MKETYNDRTKSNAQLFTTQSNFTENINNIRLSSQQYGGIVMASMNDFDNVLAGAIADLAKNPTWFSEGDVQSDVYKKLSE